MGGGNTIWLEPRYMYDSCLLRCEDGVNVYDAHQIIETLYNDFSTSSDESVDDDDLWLEAHSYFEYNMLFCHVGPYTPKYEFPDYDEEESSSSSSSSTSS